MGTLPRTVGTSVAFATLVAASGTPVASAPQSLAAVHVRSIGGGPLPGHFNGPRGIAVDRTGRVFVADRGYCRIQVFDQNGRFLYMWGTRGSGPGQFLSPWNLALDAAGQVYVTDARNHRVHVFTVDGAFLRGWGTRGAAPGQFTRPGGIAVDGDGNVFVADENDRVQMFTGAGAFVRQWGSRGRGNGQFTPPSYPPPSGPGGIAVNRDGLVYVADSWSSRVQVFTRTGEFVRAFGSIARPGGAFNTPAAIAAGREGGRMNTPEGLAVDTDGNVFVADEGRYSTRGAYTIQKFTADGVFLNRWGRDGFAPGQFDGPAGVAVDTTGNFYVADTANNRVQKFNKHGQFLTQWGSICDGCLRGPIGLAFDADGSLIVADSANKQVQKFAKDGRFLAKWGTPGSWTPGSFLFPSAVATDGRRILVADAVGGAIQVFDTEGRFLSKWTLPDDASPRGLLLREGQVLIFDTNRILALSPDGVVAGRQRLPRHAWASDLALDHKGNLYVAETHEDEDWSRIRVVDAQGRETARWNLDPPGTKTTTGAHLAVDRHERVFVTDWQRCRVRVFTVTGALLWEWGSCGFGDGQFDNMEGIAIDENGLIYVSDYLNNRVQVFRVREPSTAPSTLRQ